MIAVSSTSILITWQYPKEFDANGILTKFLIILTDSMGNERNFTQSASTFSLHLESKLLISTANIFVKCLFVTGLKKFHVYAVEVLAENDKGKGPSSEPISITTLEDGVSSIVLCVHKLDIVSFAVPSAPLDPSVELVNSTAVTLKWSPPDSPNGNLLYYRITFYGYKTDLKVNHIYKTQTEFLILLPSRQPIFFLKKDCFGRVVLCCFAFLLFVVVALPFFLSISLTDCSCIASLISPLQEIVDTTKSIISHKATVALTGLQPGITYRFEVAILPISTVSDHHFYYVYRLKQVQALDLVKGFQLHICYQTELTVNIICV